MQGTLGVGAPAPAPAAAAPAPAPAQAAAVPEQQQPAGLTMEEVAKHSTEQDCWWAQWVGCSRVWGGLGRAPVSAAAKARGRLPAMPSVRIPALSPWDRFVYQGSVYDVTQYMAENLHPGERF